MHPISDVDALLLMAITLSSKRRPAELLEIMAAAELIRSPLPAEADLARAFLRLSSHGLIAEAEGGFALTAEAQKLMGGERRKGEAPERLVRLKETLAAYEAKGEHVAVEVGQKQLCAAILEHRVAQKSAAKNLLVPKPKAPETGKGPGVRRRKPMAPRGKRKD
ncbi:MAG: hypothetical protein ACM3SV_01910 [Betaproteobacteria bacterium]